MIWFSPFLASLLVLLLLGSVPIRTCVIRFSIALSRRLQRERRSTDDLWNNLISWLLVFLLVLLCPGLNWSPQMLGLRPPTNIYLAGLFFAAFTLFTLAFVGLQHWVVRNIPAQKLIPSLYSNFPRTTKERFLFAASALTAGFCEELLFRGFLPLYLTQIFPHFPFVVAMLVAALIFGLAHARQPANKVLMLVPVFISSIIGFIYGLFYIGTSSILLPMILHALFDLRVLWFEYPGRLDRTKQLKEEETSLPL